MAPNHGSWYFHCSTVDIFGRAQRVRRGGHPSQTAAAQAMEAFLAQGVADRTVAGWTVARWLRFWLSTRTAIRPTTRLSHTGYIEQFLIPHLGHIRLGELTVQHLATAFERIGQETNRSGKPHTPCTLAHIRTTLRAALNAAVREGLLPDNPARRLELPTHAKPRPVVWSRARVAAWQATGRRPAVAVWTPTQLKAFLHVVRDDRLYGLWWLLALRGLRRSEAAALRWSDLDLDHAELTISKARTTAAYQVYEGDPKTQAGWRTIALDKHTVKVLHAHQRRQRLERGVHDGAWDASGYVFTAPDGRPLHPDAVTRRFVRLLGTTDLPPIRLHDLRHGAACLAHAAGADLKTLQHQLGHASIAVTADIYTTVLPAVQRRCAKATARLLRSTRRQPRRSNERRSSERCRDR
ncbi:tyrosine-type recombinase/integrase [Dactylosporangium roseum]|uniref:tyrosine-type recombinase/integrase n=1 Tax=Dactylosporangium roseum TaxID=47989 RepID=UPI0021B3D49E|nr:site-specific integrase [Dactylosporangium roseum]